MIWLGNQGTSERNMEGSVKMCNKSNSVLYCEIMRFLPRILLSRIPQLVTHSRGDTPDLQILSFSVSWDKYPKNLKHSTTLTFYILSSYYALHKQWTQPQFAMVFVHELLIYKSNCRSSDMQYLVWAFCYISWALDAYMSCSFVTATFVRLFIKHHSFMFHTDFTARFGQTGPSSNIHDQLLHCTVSLHGE